MPNSVSKSQLHPAEQFAAPGTITKGEPLKHLIGPPLVRLIGQSFAAVIPSFQSRSFIREATSGLDELELTPRAIHVAEAMARQLPADFDAAAPLLIQTLGPRLTTVDGNGLAPFFYLPHSYLIAKHGVARFQSGMQAIYELTQRFTAEFCIRPFLIEHQDQTLQVLHSWVDDPSPHVRRLVSEGSRPRLPWGMRLRNIQTQPSLSLPLLERLKDDGELYVRRSVANHLADILKDHPELIFDLCHRWIEETRSGNVTFEQAQARYRMIRHAVRLPAKKGHPTALKLRQLAAATRGRQRDDAANRRTDDI